MTVHEDDVELYWPLTYSICYPVWQAACVSNTPFYPYPLVCPIEEARVVFKNMMFGAQELPSHIVAIDVVPIMQGEDTRRSSELTTPTTLEPKGGPKIQVHIPKDEMVLASKSLMELDATCDKRVGAQLQGIGRKRGTKVIQRVKTKLSLLMNFEQKSRSYIIFFLDFSSSDSCFRESKVRKKRPVVLKTKSESTESFTEAPVQEGYFNDDEMNSALLLLEHQLGSSKRAALRIAEALNRGKVASRKLRAYLGEEAASTFLRTITKPHWLMTLLANALGSMKSALNCVDIYRTSEVGSSEHKEAISRLIDVAGNENFVKAFVQRFAALRETVANSLMAQLKITADEVDQIIVGCLGGANIPMRRIESLTGAKVEVIQGLLNALKRCNEEEVEMYLQILLDCIAGKLKSDEETAERLARIQKHETELEHQIQKHQQGLEEYRYRRKSAIIITMPTKEQPLQTIDVRLPEIISKRQEKLKGKKKGTKAATMEEKVKKEVSKEKKQVASVKTVTEANKAEEEVEELSIGEAEITMPFPEFTVLDVSSSQSTLSDEIPQRTPSFTAGSVLSMEVGLMDVIQEEDIRLIDTRLSKRVWDLKRAVGCEGFLEPDIGLEPNRIVLVLVRSAINAKANQLLEMIKQVQTLLKNFLVLESVRETVRYMWDLLFRKIATKLRNGEYDAGEKAIYLEVGRRVIKQLKQLGVNIFRYVSHLEASIIRKSVTDPIIKRQDLFPETPVVPNVDLGDLLKTIKEVSWKSLSSFGQIIPTIHFSIKEAVEETESTYSMAAPSSSSEKKKLPSSSSNTSVPISVDLPLTEKQLTITEGELSAEPSDSELMWLPSTSRGMVSTSTAAGSQFVDFESFDEVPEHLQAKWLYEAYGGEMRGTRTSLIRKAQEMVENPTVFDVAELRSSKSFDLENVDEVELELAVAKVIQKMEDEEAATRLTRIATPEIEEVETLEMRLARIRTLIAQGRSRATEEESPKEIETVSLTPPLPPYRVDLVKYQLRNIIEELEMSRSSQQGLNALERILWITMPENVADRYELFVLVADLQRYRPTTNCNVRGQFSGDALKALLESVLVDVTDLLTLLDPDFEIEDEQRYNIYDQLRTNLDVLCWFKIDIDGYEEQLRSLTKVVDVETPQPWHMVTLQGTEVDLKLSSVDSEEESVEKQSEQINKTIQFAPLADSLTEEIKERMHEKNLGELFSELPPTQNQTNKLAAYMKWRKNKLEMAGTTARCLFSVAPEIVDQDRDIFLEVIKLVEPKQYALLFVFCSVQALSAEVATLFVSSTLQDLLDLMLIALNKDDFQKDERQMAYNQCRAMMEALQCFKVPIKEFKSNFDLLDAMVYFCLEFFVALPQACIQELPFEVLEAIGGRLRIEETEREPLKSYLKHIDAQAFVDQDKYDFERTRALAVHALRLHPQDVNGMIKHEIEVLPLTDLLHQMIKC
ncbi:unnamed protein product [Taenia asiatica]|uniref:Uncharacterized protein n=1 Tax=Taenia asiatica TaxID=60517 RepID=A0A3P6Q1V5_TAEAS|nr:unnamed protein product [Taenia asiatica]